MAKKGFTLMELLIVISLLSILGTLLFMIINPNRQVDKAKEAEAKSEVRMIKQAIITYFDDHNDYPPAGDDFCNFVLTCTGTGDYWASGCCGGTILLDVLSPKYMPRIEKDPWGEDYYYDKNYNKVGDVCTGMWGDSWSFICSGGPNKIVDSDISPNQICGRPGTIIEDDICVYIEESE